MAAILKIHNGGHYSSQITCLHFLYDSNNKKLSMHKSSCFYDNLNNSGVWCPLTALLLGTTSLSTSLGCYMLYTTNYMYITFGRYFSTTTVYSNAYFCFYLCGTKRGQEMGLSYHVSYVVFKFKADWWTFWGSE